jgi:DNA-directed RNA polymerase specialized sigma24 family protein
MYFSHEAIVRILSTGTEQERSQAWNYLIKESGWAPMAIGYMVKRGVVQEDARDILFEALMDVENNLRRGQYRGDGNIEAYFMRIIRNKCNKHLGKKRRYWGLFDWLSKDDEDKDDDHDVLKWYEQKDAAQYIGKIAQEVGKHCAEIMGLYQLNYSMPEVAETMGFPNADQAKTEYKRCVKRIRDRIAQNPEWKNFFK